MSPYRNIRNFISLYPCIYGKLYKFVNRTGQYIEKDTDFVVDGFPRSSNSFCEAAFSLYFPTAKIAHHTHSIAILKDAISRNIPAFVMIREPKSTILSCAVHIKCEEAEISNLINEYINFYCELNKIKSGLYIASFDRIRVSIAGEIHNFCMMFKITPPNKKISEKEIYSRLDSNSKQRRPYAADAEPYSINATEQQRISYELSKDKYRTHLESVKNEELLNKARLEFNKICHCL